jgi:hypothetical protein
VLRRDRVAKVHTVVDRMICLADAEYKLLGEDKFRVITRPINKLIFVVLIEEQTFEEEAEAMEDNNGREEQPPISNQLPLEGGQEQVSEASGGEE